LPLSDDLREVRRASLGGAALFGKLGAAAAFAGYATRVARFARKRGATLLHCNSLKADIYGALAGRMARLPVVWHVRDHIDPSYLPGPAVKSFRLMARTLPRYVLTNSVSTREKLFPAGVSERRCRAVHDGLADRELTAPLPAVADRWRHDPPRVGIVGRFVEWKGQHVFLEAAQKLVTSGVEARFVLVGAPLFGEQGYAATLEKQAAALGGRVEFTGFQSDIPRVMRELDVFVHASTTPEPFGQVVIEAMAEGLPVIASDGGGIREIIIDGRNGILTPMGNADALAAALGALLHDPARANCLARAGHEHVRHHFTAIKNARAIEAVYEDIYSSQQGGAQHLVASRGDV
jgi:glycosyltransferase involved in cell wall biosynthesis